MEILSIAVKEINPAEYNPRKDLKPGDPEYEKLKKSILEFDMVEPLVWNKQTGNLVGGHQRLKILQELGAKKVDVSVVDLSPVKEKALNIALNKIQGEWDFSKLKDLLQELDTGEFDIEITGFDVAEIEDLMTQFHVPGEGLTDDDAIPEKVETVCKTGDLWQLGEHRLLCGDATKKEDVERLMGGEKADMVFTDPPYNVNLEYNDYEDNKTKPDFIKWCKNWFKFISAIAPKQIIFIGNVNTQLWITNFKPDYIAIWDKGDGGNTHGYITQYTLWEPIFFHGKFKRKRHNDIFRFIAGGTKIDHPCPKPISLLDDILESFSDAKEVIVDIFGGSGSTLIACEKLGRKCRMMEIAEHYCDVIITRWQNFTGNQAVKIDAKTNTEAGDILP